MTLTFVLIAPVCAHPAFLTPTTSYDNIEEKYLVFFFFLLDNFHMMSSPSPASRHMPADVLRHHIFPALSLSELVVCSFVSKTFRDIAKPLINSRSDLARTNRTNPRIEIMEFIWSYGSVELLHWFQERLHFPFTISPGLLFLAAKGIRDNSINFQ